MWEQLEGTAADCIPAAGSGLFHCDKVSFVEAKASRVKGPKDDCYTLNWMEMRFLTHINTHSILPSRTRTNTLSAKRACTPVTNPAFIVATLEHTNNNTHKPTACADDNSYAKPLGLPQCGKKKKLI